jgi:hypothetical protein
VLSGEMSQLSEFAGDARKLQKKANGTELAAGDGLIRGIESMGGGRGLINTLLLLMIE